MIHRLLIFTSFAYADDFTGHEKHSYKQMSYIGMAAMQQPQQDLERQQQEQISLTRQIITRQRFKELVKTLDSRQELDANVEEVCGVFVLI